MRDRLTGLPVFVERCVQFNVVDAVLVKYLLTPLVLALYRHHGPAHLVSGQVAYLTDQVRKSVE